MLIYAWRIPSAVSMFAGRFSIAVLLLCLPLQLALGSQGSPSYDIWVCMAENDQIRIIDSVRFEDNVQDVINVTMGEYPWRIAFSPDGMHAIVLCRESNNIVIFDARERTEIMSMEGFARPCDVEFSPDGSAAYVTNSGGGTVSVVDPAAWTLSEPIEVGSGPGGVALSSDGRQACVCLPSEGKLAVIGLEDGSVQTIEVDAGPWDVDIAPDGKRAYVSCEDADTVCVVSLDDMETKRRVGVTEGPRGLVAIPDGHAVYVPGREGVAIVETRRDSKIDVSGIHGWGWEAIAIPDSSHVFVSTEGDPGEEVVEVIDVGRMEKIETVYLGENARGPRGLAIHPLGSGGKVLTSMSCSAASGDGDGAVVVQGYLLPPAPGRTVTLRYEGPDGAEHCSSVSTGPDGGYRDGFETELAGEWTVEASWPGTDDHEGASARASFRVGGVPIWGDGVADLQNLANMALMAVSVLAVVVAAYAAAGGRDR